jgi:hypothetical protein
MSVGLLDSRAQSHGLPLLTAEHPTTAAFKDFSDRLAAQLLWQERSHLDLGKPS